MNENDMVKPTRSWLCGFIHATGWPGCEVAAEAATKLLSKEDMKEDMKALKEAAAISFNSCNEYLSMIQASGAAHELLAGWLALHMNGDKWDTCEVIDDAMRFVLGDEKAWRDRANEDKKEEEEPE